METRWTSNEDEKVNAAFAALCELHKQKPSLALSRIYYRVFEQYPAADVVMAIERAIQTHKWFPKPAELVEFITGDPEEQAIKAWTILESAIGCVGTYRSVLFEDPKICAAIKFLGGWEEIGNWPMQYMGKRREEFITAYKALKNPPATEKLIGRGEDVRMLKGAPNLNPWSIVKRDGEIVHMRRVLLADGADILDLPEPQHFIHEPLIPEQAGGRDLISVSKLLPELMGAFK